RYSLTYGSPRMTTADFRRIALSLEGVEEYSHAGLPAFRVGGRKFASLASQAGGYGNLMLTLEQQAAFVEEAPEIFLPIPGGWGKMGHTHIRLAAASEDVLTGAIRTAWKLRVEKNAKTRQKPSHVAEHSGVANKSRGKR
ncbi:MAG TPA: MmcQ/YjbR family DNA-binding protein, partial [Terriglobales bacterium]|nr:MmcQ/YjbR family DNA-binding protein [Terriglobales bacterium]